MKTEFDLPQGDAGSKTYVRVIVPVNGYPLNDRAVPIAVAMVDQFGGDLELASMVYSREFHAERSRLVHLLTLRLQGRGVLTSIEEGSDPSAYVLDLINRPESLVVLAGGTSVLGIPGSVTTDVLRFAARPFVIVGPRINPNWIGPVQRIVVALDGSQSAEEALTSAVLWARTANAVIDLVQVLDPTDVHRAHVLATDISGTDVFESGYLETVVHGVLKDVGLRINFDTLHATKSHRSAALNEYLSNSTNTLLCMASNGFHKSRSMVASTTLRTIHASTAPVLIVRT